MTGKMDVLRESLGNLPSAERLNEMADELIKDSILRGSDQRVMAACLRVTAITKDAVENSGRNGLLSILKAFPDRLDFGTDQTFAVAVEEWWDDYMIPLYDLLTGESHG